MNKIMDQHLSYSQIYMYMDCARRWQGHYLLNKKEPEGESLMFGSLSHAVIEAFIMDKTVVMRDLWIDAFTNYILSGRGNNIAWDDTPEATMNIGIRLFSSLETIDVLSTIDPRFVEREIHLTLPDLPDVIGYIDCIQTNGIPLDFKTAGKMWPDGKASKELQPLIYLMALEQLGEHDHGFKFQHVVLTKTKNPRVVIFESQRSPEEFELMQSIIYGVWRGITNGFFLPNPTSWLCNVGSCGMWSECVGKGK